MCHIYIYMHGLSYLHLKTEVRTTGNELPCCQRPVRYHSSTCSQCGTGNFEKLTQFEIQNTAAGPTFISKPRSSLNSSFSAASRRGLQDSASLRACRTHKMLCYFCFIESKFNKLVNCKAAAAWHVMDSISHEQRRRQTGEADVHSSRSEQRAIITP
jgi:hypothetical protein